MVRQHCWQSPLFWLFSELGTRQFLASRQGQCRDFFLKSRFIFPIYLTCRPFLYPSLFANTLEFSQHVRSLITYLICTIHRLHTVFFHPQAVIAILCTSVNKHHRFMGGGEGQNPPTPTRATNCRKSGRSRAQTALLY